MIEKLQKYIKSGEFTFCSRCGVNVCYDSKEFMCESCKRQLFGGKINKEIILAELYESKISKLIREHRKKLAELRMKDAERDNNYARV